MIWFTSMNTSKTLLVSTAVVLALAFSLSPIGNFRRRISKKE